MIYFPGGLHKPFSSPNDDQSIVGAIYLVMLVIWCLTLGIFVCVNKCRKMKPKRSAISLTTASLLVMTRRERFRRDFMNGMFPANSWTLGLVVGAMAVFSVIKK
ncbi:Protein CBG11797 [Caenorhabditis briggsae]|uniref:Protein CBG11797 n=1 Tax=Caenorhabditis briggsae TaxID=6238 RepID=A8XE25_CAEBR|nr:Protein CBG11797 [Caenorhabditis briggsae]CAP30895.1 Protein CBG11797 [Caenorhabditis briggsae]